MGEKVKIGLNSNYLNVDIEVALLDSACEKCGKELVFTISYEPDPNSAMFPTFFMAQCCDLNFFVIPKIGTLRVNEILRKEDSTEKV